MRNELEKYESEGVAVEGRGQIVALGAVGTEEFRWQGHAPPSLEVVIVGAHGHVVELVAEFGVAQGAELDGHALVDVVETDQEVLHLQITVDELGPVTRLDGLHHLVKDYFDELFVEVYGPLGGKEMGEGVVEDVGEAEADILLILINLPYFNNVFAIYVSQNVYFLVYLPQKSR